MKTFWILVTGAVLLASCGGAQNADEPAATGEEQAGNEDLPSIVGIATLPVGSVNHIIGEALAAAITEHTEITARAEPIGGPEAWVPAMARGEVQFGLASDFDLYAARTGQDPYFDEAYPDLRVAKQAQNALRAGILTQANSDIEGVEDLAGRRLAYDAPAHAVVLEGTKALMAVYEGPPVEETESVRVDSSTDAVQALIDGRADAALASVGSATIEELSAAHGARFLSHEISEDGLAAAREILPTIVKATVEPGPTGVEETSDFIAWSINLVTHESVSPELVSLVTRALYENHDDYADAHPIMSSLAPEKSLGTLLSAPVHEGAIGFYQETEVWSDEVEQAHNEAG